MSNHYYINSAFCEQSEFYPALSSDRQQQPLKLPPSVETKLKNRNYLNNKKCSPAKVHRSESTRSIHSSVTKQQQQQSHFVRGGSQRINTQYQPNSYILNQQRYIQSELPPIPGPKPFLQYEESEVASVLRSSSTVGTRYGLLPPNETITNGSSNTGRYALVPVEDIPSSDKGRYAVLPGHAVNQITKIPMRFTKSQDNIDRYESLPIIEEPNISLPEDSFTSLPPFSQPHQKLSNEPKMNHGFSSDFGNKSFVLVDQKSMQRYAIVPTEDNEEIVDDNHEIIQMHNGRPHRYAVIPTEDDEDEEEETCLSSGTFEMSPIPNKNFDNHNQNNNSTNTNLSHNYATIKESNSPSQPKITTSTPQKIYGQSTQNNKYQQQQQQIQHQQQQQQILVTPKKNPLATQKLHELLSTPQKVKRQTPVKTPVTGITTTSTPRIINTPTKSVSHHINKQSGEFTPQRLQYEQQTQQQQHHQQQQQLHGKQKNKKIRYVEEKTTSTACQLMEQRTTAVITPRLMMVPSSNYSGGGGETITSGTTSVNKSWNNLSFHKVANATATIGVVSLMLILCGMMNSGVCLYLMSAFGRSYFLDVGLVSGFAAITLGFLGFRSRQCEWLPNRNYISGYILVTVFSLLNCCGLLVLLALHPYPGTPLHDVTTGVILGLSSLTLLLISLGVITSRWCHVPPPDNRVDVY